MSTTVIASIIGGLVFAVLYGSASKKHAEVMSEIQPDLPNASIVEQEAHQTVTTELTESPKADIIVQNKQSDADTKAAREAVIVEQLIQRAYEIWRLRKKVIPIGLSIMLGPLALFFLTANYVGADTAKYVGTDYIFYFAGFVFFCFVGGPIYMLAELGSKTQQYALLIDELGKYDYSHHYLKQEFKERYQTEKYNLRE